MKIAVLFLILILIIHLLYSRTDPRSSCDKQAAEKRALLLELEDKKYTTIKKLFEREIKSITQQQELRGKQLRQKRIEKIRLTKKSLDFSEKQYCPNILTNYVYYKRQLPAHVTNVHILSVG